MPRRLAIPGIFLVAFAVIWGQAFSVFVPIFFQVLPEPGAPGQALRESMKWIALHLSIPLAGALIGAAAAGWIQNRRGRGGDR